MTIKDSILELATRAKSGSAALVSLSTDLKNMVLLDVADLLLKEKKLIKAENNRDLKQAESKGLSRAMLDRLEITDGVIETMASGLHELSTLPDPVGSIENLKKRPNGLLVGRMRVPLGVIGMIYESRPNVTIDAAALCLKAGNSVILRGGSEAIYSNVTLTEIFKKALRARRVVEDVIQIISTTDRAAINHLLTLENEIDLIIPRGGEGLIRFVAENSRIPVLKHYRGVCHIYVDKDADFNKATAIILNSKIQRPGVCNALEGLLIHEKIADTFVNIIAEKLSAGGVKIKGCARSVAISSLVSKAEDDDWGTEFLDLTLCLKIVETFAEARTYIRRYGSRHTESIITENYTTAQRFITEVDASAVMVNAATRFNDGGQLGLGTEIGISTTKLHAYGPMGLEELTTRKFVVYGQGQVRM